MVIYRSVYTAIHEQSAINDDACFCSGILSSTDLVTGQRQREREQVYE